MREDVQWLVKSSGRILGPYSAEQVGELLKTRELSLLDEVQSPGRRWLTVQYHESFRAIVESVRKSSLSDKTEGNWTPTTTGGLTMTLTDVVDGDLTEEITGYNNTQREIVIHNVHEQAQSVPVSLGSGRYQAAGAQNVAVQQRVEKTTRGLWIVTAVILLAVGIFIFQKRVGKGALEPKATFASLKLDVVSDVQVGSYASALNKMKSYFPDPMQAGELSIYYGSLLIQLENQTLVGRRLLNNVISANRPEAKQAYTGLGIADLIDNQLDSAQENFNKALQIDAGYVPAQINLAVTALLKGDYEGARQQAMRTMQSGSKQAEAILTLAEAELYLFKGGHGNGGLQQVSKLIEEYRGKGGWDYAAELDFYKLYLDYLRGDRAMDEKLAAYLDQDPQLTNDHRHSIFIYRGHMQWKVLARLCEQMTEKLGDGARVAALLASCYSHEGRWENARQQIDRGVAQSPKDPLVQAWNSYILKEGGDADQASVILGRTSEFNRRGEFVLPNILQARFCQQLGDVDCADLSWKKVRDRDLNYLPAVAGLAWVHTQKAAHGEAMKYLEQGLRISADYIPILQLKQKAEKEGWYVAN